ncbi:hypothetical protein BP5796_01251 [Coleophoma crateriformis]|uniref:Uncharacterized protein n=1 Tax=Coleophoma crateriformis TaxID=565419 RepID=A0A3D8SZV4_9HELO|nr:hypothetical protein BP5796_01251 [Coleophoma crateriformis]
MITSISIFATGSWLFGAVSQTGSWRKRTPKGRGIVAINQNRRADPALSPLDPGPFALDSVEKVKVKQGIARFHHVIDIRIWSFTREDVHPPTQTLTSTLYQSHRKLVRGPSTDDTTKHRLPPHSLTMPADSTSGRSANSVQPKDMSQNAVIKDAGFTGMQHMMQSYGLKMYDAGDVTEAKAIIDGTRQNMQANWEQQHAASKK